MANLLSRLLPFTSRTRQADDFAQQFQKIAAHSVAAAGELIKALQGDRPREVLARIEQIEHEADEAVRAVHRLVDRTFIAPYDKRDIVLLSQRLDDIVDQLRTAARLVVSYRATESRQAAARSVPAVAMCGMIQRSAAKLKEVVDAMPEFDHDRLREAMRSIDAIEDQCDETFAESLRAVFHDPDQPMTAEMLAWRDIYRLLERATDSCGHAMGVIISIARQEGS